MRLAAERIRYFFVDTHGLTDANPRPVHGVYAPVFTEAGVAAFDRALAFYRSMENPPPAAIAASAIVMVAIPHEDVSEATLYSLRAAAQRSLGHRPGARLAVVTVISPNASSSTDSHSGTTSISARSGRRDVKKIMLHSRFSTQFSNSAPM